MPYQRLIIVQPCYSLEDLPRNLTEDTAANYHACWTAMWHPSLLAKLPNLPEWKRSDTGSLDVKDALIALPNVSQSHVDVTLRERIEASENTLLENIDTREQWVSAFATVMEVEILERKFASLPQGTSLPQEASMSQELPPDTEDAKPSEVKVKRSPLTANTFFALGYAYQQLHILTRKVHYGTNLDLTLFHDQVNQAAMAYVDEDGVECERWLQSCFDQLSQERDRYFSQKANLLDVCLLLDSTLGKTLSQQLDRDTKHNFIASADTLSKLASDQPETFTKLQTACQSEQVSIAGGLDREAAHAWLPAGTLRRDLIAGRKAYEDLNLNSPKVFARLTSHMLSSDSQMLVNAGYQYAVMSAWLDGILPVSDQAKIRWQAPDGKMLDALSAFVLDASSALSLVSIAVELAKQFDYHQVPTLLLTHWPNQYCEAFDDLRLACERTGALGNWITLDDYFATTSHAYSNTVLPTSQFQYPLPSSIIEATRFSDALRLANRMVELGQFDSSLANLAIQLAHWTKRTKDMPAFLEVQSHAESLLRKGDWSAAASLNEFLQTTAQTASGYHSDASSAAAQKASLIDQLQKSRQQIAASIAAVLSGQPLQGVDAGSNASAPTTIEPASLGRTILLLANKSVLLFNPHPSPQRYFLRTGAAHLECQQSDRIYAADQINAENQEAIIDVPAMGLVQLSAKLASSSMKLPGSRLSSIAASNRAMSNEFLDVQLDPKTGHLRSLLVARKRGSRMSGQLTIANPSCLFDDATTASLAKSKTNQYAEPTQVQMRIEHNSSTSAIVVANGALQWQRKSLANFEIRYELWRGSRLLQVETRIEWLIDSSQLQKASEQGIWSAAPTWRTAWPSDAASMRYWPHQIATKASAAVLFCNNVIEIDDAEHKLSLMWDNVYQHRRQESHYLDSHLNDGKTSRFLIGIDVPTPLQTFHSWTQPPLLLMNAPPLSGNQTSASLTHCSRRGVDVQWLDVNSIDVNSIGQKTAIETDEKKTTQPAACLWVQECLGKPGNVELGFFRDVASAWTTDALGNEIERLKIVEGQIQMAIKSCESSIVAVTWT